MANTKQAKKRIRQTKKRQQHNASMRSTLRTYTKRVIAATKSGHYETAAAALKVAIPILDKMINKRIIHKNTAARYKSRLSMRVKELSTHRTPEVTV